MQPADGSSAMFITLHGLEAALSHVRAVVLAAHPDLDEEGPNGLRLMKLDAAGWMADEILTHLSALGGAIARYSVEAERARTRSALGAVQGMRKSKDRAA